MPLDLMEDLSRGNSWLSFARGSSAIDYEHGEYRNRGGSPTVKTGAFPSRTPTVREGTHDPGDRTGARKDNTNYAGKTYNSVDSIAEFFKQRTAQLGNTSGTFQSSREKAEQEKSNRRHSQRPTSNVQRPVSTGSDSDRIDRGNNSSVRTGGSNDRGASNSSQTQSSNTTIPNSERETRNSKPETAPSDFIPGSYVLHAKYGRGLVLRREGVGDSLKLTVTFPGYGQKKLIQKYAGLERA
jgi:hypothetical protein